MRRRIRIHLMAAALGCAACAGPGAGKTAYVGATLISGTAAAPVANAVVIVSEGRIEAAGPADQVSVPRGAEVVTLDGHWIIPGLIDAYARPERWALGPMLSYGVTSIRAVGGVQDTALFLRTDVQTGATAGPRLYITGALIDGAGSPLSGATTVRTTNDGRRAVDNRVLVDATFVAVGPRITGNLLTAILDEARTFEAPVSAELGRVHAVAAARAGVTLIDRLTGIVEATVGNPSPFYDAHRNYEAGRLRAARAWSGMDSASSHRTARSLNEQGAWLLPALVTFETWARLRDPTFTDSIDLSGVPEATRETWNAARVMRRLGLSAADVAALRRARNAQDRFVRLFAREGGRIVAGSTGPDELIPPGAALHKELELMVGAGLTEAQALNSATRQAAALLRADTIGVVAPGNVADFVVLRADPLADIRNTRQITMVVTYGISYRPEQLRGTP